MAYSFTPAQQNALDIKRTNVLVSAAAGSGKTFTLTQRIIKNILEKNADISRILVVTFTRAAASELKSRISSALMDAISEHPENTHLQNQLLLLGDADISTIDSFLSRPVRENFEKLGLPSSMRIADAAEIQTLSQNIFDEVMAAMYDKYKVCGNGSLSDMNFETPLTDLISLLTTVKDSSDFFPYIRSLYDRLITSPRGVELLCDFSTRLKKDSECDFLKTREGEFILSELCRICEGALAFYNSAREQLLADELLTAKYLPTFDDDKTQIESIMDYEGRSYAELSEKLGGFPSSRLGTLKEAQKTPASIRLQASRKDVSDQIKGFYKTYFSFTSEDISKMYKKTSDITYVLYEIISEFDKKLMSEKLRLGIYEFSDMPRYMLSLLKDEDGEKSAVAQKLSENYDEIYIDEYQDVNEIQDEIFRLISNNNRFMVGDIKQSIYGFRDAEPIFFSNYRNLYPIYDPEGENDARGSTIFMSENFRSDKNVIDFSNMICSPMFRSCGDEINYQDEDDLVCGKSRPKDHISQKVQVNIFGKGLGDHAKSTLPLAEIVCDDGDTAAREDGLCEEAVFTANEIARLLRTEKKANGESIRPCDIAILVRKNSGIDTLTKALSELNIQYLLASKSRLLESREMTLLVSLCEILDNPRNDIPLCSVMTCESLKTDLRFTTGEILTIRNHSGKKMSLYDSVCLYGEDGEGDPLETLLCRKCRAFRDMVSDARAYALKLSAEKFLRMLSAHEFFLEFCKGEAFKFMYDSACKYVKNSWSGLSGFIRYFKSIIENGNISGEIKPIENAVNIVTMHSSKGLQYNTCFVYGCGAAFNTSDTESALIYDKDICLGMLIPEHIDGQVNTVKRDSLIHNTVALHTKNKLRAEEMRILYVALTRAEERLYVSGTIPGVSTYESYLRKFNTYGISDTSTFSQSSLLSWVVGGMCISKEKNDSYTVKLHSVFANTPLCTPFEIQAQEADTALSALMSEYAALINSPPSQDREEIILSSIPAKAPASKVSPAMLDKSVFSSIPSGILFSNDNNGDESADNAAIIKNRIELMRSNPASFDSLLESNKKPTASERGTAMHMFLQYCDYENIKRSGVRAEIARLGELGFMSKRNSDILYVKQLENFFQSEFFERILNAKSIRREFKFGMFRSASEFTEDEELASLVSDRKIYIQGSIDLLIECPDGSVYICDYKTDRVLPEEINNIELLRERMRLTHKDQLSQYAYAVEKIFGKAPEKTFIISLSAGLALEI